MSILVRLVLVFLTPKNHSVLINNFLNLAQGIYLIIVLIMWSHAHNDYGVFDMSKLTGDSFGYFSEALMMHDQRGKSFLELRELSRVNYFLFQYILSKVIFLFKSEYLSSLMFVVFTGLLNLLLLFKIGVLLNFKKQIIKTIGVFYIIFPHILASNTVLLKDSLLLFSFLLIIYSALCINIQNNNNFFKLSIYSILSLFLCFFIRLPFTILFILCFYYLATKNYSKLRNIIIFSLFTSFILSNYFLIQFDKITLSASQLQRALIDGEVYGSGLTNLLVGSYATDPFYLKIIKLPLVVFVQYTHPMNIFTFSHSNPWEYININMKIIWLVFFGPIFLFSFFQRKFLQPLLKRLLIISVTGYVLIAYLETGLVPRYALLFMCLSILPLAYIFQEIKTNLLLKRKFMFFKRIYFYLFIFLSFSYIIYKL
ncbi:hypothetical protein HN451_01805 [archaeon]|nr:hypothetical protein [archaeon]